MSRVPDDKAIEVARLLRVRMFAMRDRFESRDKAREACKVILREHYGDVLPVRAEVIEQVLDAVLEVLER